jgi:hypothetical protein
MGRPERVGDPAPDGGLNARLQAVKSASTVPPLWSRNWLQIMNPVRMALFPVGAGTHAHFE